MNRILVIITLAEGALEKIKSNPELPKKEMEFVNQWKEEGILESFFISVSKMAAVLIFKNAGENKVKELIGILPYFPFMAKVEYQNLEKHF
ncbi:MAG TPA: muconolactone Delta-isomerase family protein [Bacteroidales bacterium]